MPAEHQKTEAPAALRLARPEDRPFLLAVFASTRAEELALTGWSPEQKAQFCAQQFYAQDTYYRAQYPAAEFFVIERDGEPAGRLYLHRQEGELRILDISLLPEHRSRGLGTWFLRDLQKAAAVEGRKLSIHVERFNRALALYERLGFRVAGDQGVYLLMEWTPT